MCLFDNKTKQHIGTVYCNNNSRSYVIKKDFFPFFFSRGERVVVERAFFPRSGKIILLQEEEWGQISPNIWIKNTKHCILNTLAYM